MRIEIDKRFKNNLRGIIEKYSFEVGVLEDGPHYLPKRGVRGLKGADVRGSFAGGPVRKLSRKQSGFSISQVSKENRQRMRFNYLTKPFEKKNSTIIRFTNEFFKYAFGKSEPKRLTNLLQAVVRNPILRGDYGSNTQRTQKIKGFNRKMIDTAQLFKAIRARVIRR